MAGGTNKKRPYWYVDAKWISGIIFVVLFITALLSFNISQIISENNIIDTALSKIEQSIEEEIGKFFDEKGKPLSDDKGEVLSALTISQNKITELKNKAKESSDQDETLFFSSHENFFKNPLSYIQNIPLFFTHHLESAIYVRISDALDKASAKISTLNLRDKNLKEQILTEIQIPKIYSENQYHNFRVEAIVLFILSLVFLTLAIFFSTGLGRFSTPGFLILLASIPGFFLLLNFNNYLKTSPLNNLANSDQKVIQVLASALFGALKNQAEDIFVVYKYLFIIALILLAIGVFGSILIKIFQPKSTSGISPRLMKK